MKKESDIIGLVFSRDQFRLLLRMMYVANTMINGHREESYLKEYDDLEQYVFSRAKDAGFPAATWHHESEGEEHHHPSQIFESDMELNALMDEYDLHVMSEVLAEKLAERDIKEKIGADAKDRMPPKDYNDLLEAYGEIYATEFAAHGLEALRLDKGKENTA